MSELNRLKAAWRIAQTFEYQSALGSKAMEQVANTYITALEAALEKAQAPYKFDTILVTPEIVALFRERENTEQWIAEWTTRRFAQLYEHISNRQSWWVTCFQWGATELPDDLVNAARLAYIEYMTTP